MHQVSGKVIISTFSLCSPWTGRCYIYNVLYVLHLCQQIAQLNASLQTVSEEKSHMEKDLQNNMDMVRRE